MPKKAGIGRHTAWHKRERSGRLGGNACQTNPKTGGGQLFVLHFYLSLKSIFPSKVLLQGPRRRQNCLQLLPLHVAGQVPAGRLGCVAQLTHQARDLARPPPCTRPHVVQQAPQVLPGAALLPVLRLALLAPRQRLCALTQQVPAAGGEHGQGCCCVSAVLNLKRFVKDHFVNDFCMAIEHARDSMVYHGGNSYDAGRLKVCIPVAFCTEAVRAYDA